jgi:sugar lactone lactonase YvrE
VTRRRSTQTLLLLLLLLGAVGALPLYAAATYHPVAAAKAPNGSLFVLTAENTIFAVNMGLSSGAVAGQFSFSDGGIATDLAYGEVDGKGRLFVSSTFSTGQAVAGRVREFTTEGKLVESWTIQHVVAGVAFASVSKTIYFTSGDSPEIYSIAVHPKSSGQKSSAEFVGEVTGGSTLGALTMDPDEQNLYIADIRQGTVFSMSVSTHRVTRVCQVSTPQALLVDTTNQQLIVADSTRKQVVAFSLANPSAPPRVLAPEGSFKAPAGLAWWNAGHLLVADQNAGTVSLVDVGTAQRIYAVPIS